MPLLVKKEKTERVKSYGAKSSFMTFLIVGHHPLSHVNNKDLTPFFSYGSLFADSSFLPSSISTCSGSYEK